MQLKTNTTINFGYYFLLITKLNNFMTTVTNWHNNHSITSTKIVHSCVRVHKYFKSFEKCEKSLNVLIIL